MKIKLLRTMAINGKHIEAGEIAEVSTHDGTYLVNGRHADLYIEPIKPVKKQAGKVKK